MTLPPSVQSGVEAALTDRLGRATTIDSVTAVGGGCISPTGRLRTSTDETFFIKWGAPDLPDALLAAEARGLKALAAPAAVRVPEVIATDDGAETPWLLLEWLEPGGASPGSWERLGRELAALHRTRADHFGADHPNFIGSLPQRNDPSADWAGFWRERRLTPQLERALDAGLLGDDDARDFDDLHHRLPELLEPALEDGASLLHGDLWGGNVHMMADGTPAIIDPSSYHGHREVDLAMAELFGGFGRGFRAAYEATWPLAPGYAPTRRAVYQLYYLLVHVNLFGRSYVERTRSVLREAIAGP